MNFKMRLNELMETLTKPLNHGNPLVVLKVKYYNPHGETLYFTYKGCVVWARKLFDDLPQEILDREVLSTKKEKNQFGLDNNGCIVAVDYTIEIEY